MEIAEWHARYGVVAGVTTRRVDLVEPTLDDVFLTLTGGVRS